MNNTVFLEVDSCWFNSLPFHGLLGLGDHSPPLLELLLVDLEDLVLAPHFLCGLGVGQTLGYLLGAALEGGDSESNMENTSQRDNLYIQGDSSG